MTHPLWVLDPNRLRWLRAASLVGALLLLVLLPFALFGEAMDRAAPQWLQAGDGRWWLAVVGIGLLAADVLLPIPSSLVNVALCLGLGPIWGGIAVALGCLLAFTVGYGIGWLVPEARLRAWIGPELWDRSQSGARRHALWWILGARPLPVLAEISALLAGVMRLDPLRAFACATLASVIVGLLYGASAWLGAGEPHLGLTLLALLTLPAVLWIVHRLMLKRLLSAQAADQGAPHE